MGNSTLNNSNIKVSINLLAKEYFNEIVEIRRHLHRWPELSKKEFATSDFICRELDKMELSYRRNIGGNGIMGFVEGSLDNGKCVAFRADMDALPINEENNHDFVSQNPGVMHACGHDMHIASLLGTIKILKSLSNEFSGRFMFIFQPSEEEYPGGAISMLNDGVFDE
ncbi:MAG: amidohydrolase, partial [Bacteroidales bacterium]|nr:amidohydrolase [Bacteroidales bacterium]